MEKNSRKFSLIKYIGCFFRAIMTFARYGVWVMHLYGEEEVVPAYIITKGNKFRVADSLDHNANERVYLNAAHITYWCKYCGKKETSWAEDYAKYKMENPD